MEVKTYDITCNIFQDAEAVIKKAKAKIKKPRSSKERQYYAQDILLEAKTLLSCSKYNARNSNCVNCHSIARRNIEDYKHLAKDSVRKIVKSN